MFNMLEKVYVYQCRRFEKGSSYRMAKNTFKRRFDEKYDPDHHVGAVYIDYGYTGKYSIMYKLEKLVSIEYYENGQYFDHEEKVK